MPKKLEHILYVDDDAHIREVAQMCLEMVGGFNVTCLSSGTELLEQLKTINPDIILLDVMMPIIDGPTTLQKLNEENALNGTPVIFMTARVQPDEVAQYIQLGAIDVIAKPFDPMTLPEQIHNTWEAHCAVER